MEPVRVIREDLVLVDWGPMTLSIAAWRGLDPTPVIAAQAARFSLRCLADLARFKGYLKIPVAELPLERRVPPVVDRARKAAARLEAGLSPLAAVAGAVADQVADKARELGADKVLVNNGGDIALRLGPGQEALVGLKPPGPEGDKAQLLGRLRIKAGMGVGGVATSGWRGRSLSKGVADLVSVWARSSALADAAATALGNEVRVDSPAIERAEALELEPESGLGREPVTKSVGGLSGDEINTALRNGLGAARQLAGRGILKGCLLALQGSYVLLDEEGSLKTDPTALPG